MGNYSSNYTGTQIDAAIGAVNTAVNAGGIVNVNGLTTILGDYLTSATAASTYEPKLTAGTSAQFYRGDKSWSDILTSDLTVQGSLYLTRTTDAAATVDNRPALLIGPYNETHLEFDNNEIMAKSNATTTSTLYLNDNGGNTQIGGNLILNGNMTQQQGYRLFLGASNSVCMDGLLASYYSDSSSVTGTMKITLPLLNGHCVMQILEVWVYNYDSQGGSQLVISGYSYTNKDWHNYHCRVVGAYSNGCRMAHDGTNYCILLGTTSTVWKYPKLWLTRWMGGYTNCAQMYSNGLPTISLITSESGYTITGSAS